MLSRRDLIHSRQYLRQRHLCALVSHRPDPLDWAGRNAGSAAFAGIMILVIALAGTAVYGKIFPGGFRAWNKCDAVIVERETGTKYVCGLQPGILNPVLNFASAALLKGTAKQVTVARASLTWPRGELVGIPNAPDNLPPAARMLPGAWSLCSVLRPDETGARRPATVVLVGSQPQGAQPVDARAMVVVDPGGARHLIWRGVRFPITDPRFVLPALTLAPDQGIAVAAAWLAPLPAGPALEPIEVPGAGGDVPGTVKVKVGQFATVTTADGVKRTYLAQQGGLQEVTELQRSLVRSSAPEPVALTPAELSATGMVLMNPMAWNGVQPPARLPSFIAPSTSDQIMCALMRGDSVTVTVDGVLPTMAARVIPAIPAPSRPPAADAVIVAPGHGALVTAMASPTATSGATILVTDLGIRYACATNQVPKALGVAVDTVPIPAGLLELLPEGPSLDPALASRIFVQAGG